MSYTTSVVDNNDVECTPIGHDNLQRPRCATSRYAHRISKDTPGRVMEIDTGQLCGGGGRTRSPLV
jgi:hypothetical protein